MIGDFDPESEDDMDFVDDGDYQGSKKGVWTEAENQRIVELIRKHGTKWTEICKELPGRTPKQCCAKWYRSLDPSIKKSEWTEEENEIIKDCFKTFGGKWAAMARKLPGRTDKAIKNHFMRSFDKTTDFKDRKHSKKRVGTPDYIDFTAEDVQSIARKLNAQTEAKVASAVNRAHAVYLNNSNPNTAIDEVLEYNMNQQPPKKRRAEEGGVSSSHIDSEEDSDSEEEYRESLAADLNSGKYNSRFTKEEDDKLMALVNQWGDNWNMIARDMGARGPSQCAARWNSALNPNRKIGVWTKEEDEKLIELIERHGKNWRQIVKELPGRTAKQCSAKWYRALDPSIVHTLWTHQENEILKTARRELGTKWSEMAKRLPGRTDKAVRNHWYYSINAVLNGDYSSRDRLASNDYINFTDEEIEFFTNQQNEIDNKRKSVGGVTVRSTGSATKEKGSGSKVVVDAAVSRVWTPEDDKRLLELVESKGYKWSEISKALNDVHPRKQCRERFFYLSPNVNKDPFTDEELSTILKAYHDKGAQWIEITKLMANRTDNSIKNYWHSTLKKKVENYLRESFTTAGESDVHIQELEKRFMNTPLTHEIMSHMLMHIAAQGNKANNSKASASTATHVFTNADVGNILGDSSSDESIDEAPRARRVGRK